MGACFLAGAFFVGAGMCIPGMSIGWDNAGAATNAVLSRNSGSFTRTSVSRDKHPRWPAGGAKGRSAAAVLAGAGVAAASGLGAAAALAVDGIRLAIGHFRVSFFVAQ